MGGRSDERGRGEGGGGEGVNFTLFDILCREGKGAAAKTPVIIERKVSTSIWYAPPTIHIYANPVPTMQPFTLPPPPPFMLPPFLFLLWNLTLLFLFLS